jgi:tRNA threonylcarbamoyl adenosine modification protein YjeE
MRAFGAELAAKLRGGDVVVLTGPLGAGKTTFVQGIAEGLGIADAVTSPTFVVAREHRKGSRSIGLVHVDAYRLRSADDLVDLDLEERTDSVVVIEWGRPFVDAISDEWLDIEIARDSVFEDSRDPAGVDREVTVAPHGDGWDGRW